MIIVFQHIYSKSSKNEIGCERMELEDLNMDIDTEIVTNKPLVESPLGSNIVIQGDEIEEVERHEVSHQE